MVATQGHQFLDQPWTVRVADPHRRHRPHVALAPMDAHPILDQVEAELAGVEHAIRRLDDGTYGTCEVCDRPIADDRLEARPTARTCRDHVSPGPHPPWR